MGDPACYLTFCPACDAPASIADDECPDCGTSLDGAPSTTREIEDTARE